VILPGVPPRVLDCRLIDISATGMRFLSNVSLDPESVVAVEVDDRMVLSEIRHCNPYGDKFVSGVRRLHEVPKSTLTSEPAEHVNEMIEDLRRRIYAGDEAESRVLALQAFELIVEKAAKNQAGPQPETDAWLEPQTQNQPPVTPQGPVQTSALRLPPLPPASEEPAEPAELAEPAHRKRTSWRVLMALAAALVIASLAALNIMQHRGAAKTMATNEAPMPPANAAVQTPAPAVPEPSPEPSPEPVAAQSPAPVTAPAPTPAPAPASAPAPVATAPHVAAAPASTPSAAAPKAPTPLVSRPAAPAPLRPAAATASSQGIHRARITVQEASWVSVKSDGTSIAGKILQKGEVADFDFSAKAVLHLGNANAVEIAVDGKPVGTLPGKRTLRVIEVSPDGVRSVPWFNEQPDPPARPAPLRTPQ
jgi:cytoskeletal protein RodZ